MANVKISALPSWTGSPADLRWFVMNNQGELETFKFSGYTSQLIPATGGDSYVTINVPRTHAPDDFMLVLGNHSGTTASSGINSAVLGGRNNRTTNQFGVVAGGLNNTAGYICGIFGGNGGNADGNTAMIIGGENNTCSNVSFGGIFSGLQNYLQGGNDAANQIIGGYDNRLSTNGGQGNTLMGGRSNRWTQFDSRDPYIGAPRYGLGTMLGGYQNRIEGLATDSSGSHAYPFLVGGNLNKIFGEESNNTSTTGATIINSTSSRIKNSFNSSILGGVNNFITKAYNNTIIHSVDSSVNSAETYVTSGVSLVNCIKTDITNSNNTVALGLSGRTITGGLDNTTVVEKLYIYGNTRYESRTVNDPGTINIDIFNESHIEINATGGTYTLSITPSPSEVGTPELTLLINYVSSGATITFDNSGNVQWRWSSGTPSFTAGTRSIIKVAAWAGNDVWEVSRSMNMS